MTAVPTNNPPVRRPRRLLPWLIGGGALLLLAGLYVAGYFLSGDVVPRSTTVAGVAIGGMSQAEATAELNDKLGAVQTESFSLVAGTRSAQIDPVAAGLSIDIEATVLASGVGRSWSPIHIWRVVTGGGAVAPVVTADQTSVESAVATAAQELDVAPLDATVTYEGTKPVTSNAAEGVTVDQPATIQEILAKFGSETTIAAVAAVAAPAVSTEQAEAVAAGWATTAVSEQLTLDTGQGSFVVSPEQIAASATFAVVDGTFGGQLDYNKLLEQLTNELSSLQFGAPVDAKISFGADGKPTITPSKDGLAITAEGLAAAVEPLVTMPAGQRTGTVEASVAKASFTTEQAEALGVKEVTGEFTTYYPHADYRNTNLGRAASTINGTLLMPGETFSLNDTLGERTPANGYVSGYVIQGGALVQETGGGVSQSATTVYNAMFFAGLKDVEHHPHTLYFDRYPVGREATVYYGVLDLRFTNDTDYGVLIQAYISPSSSGSRGSITVKMWSTKTWDEVRATDPVRYNYTSPTSRVSTDPKCEPQGASQGFSVSYSRQFIKDGQVAKEEKFSWTYSPQDKITCA